MGSATSPDDQRRGGRVLVAVWLGATFLIFMNLAGMWLNLWGDVPSFTSGGKAMGSVPLLDAHIAIAFAIVGNIVLMIMRAIKPQGKLFRPVAASAASFAALSIFSGFMFTFNGGDDVFSFTMEIGFVGLVGVVAYALFLVGRLRAAPRP